MNQILIFSAIIMLGIVPFCILFLWLIFKKTVIFKPGIVILFAIAICVILSYLIGVKGLFHLIWAAPIGVLALFSAYYLISVFIRKPLQELTAQIELLAQGNLKVRFETAHQKRNDELGQMSKALELMSSEMEQVVSRVVEISKEINRAGSDLQSNAEEMNHGVKKQASSAQEVSASMEQMTSIIENNTNNAQSTEKIAEISTDSVLQGNQTSEQSAKEVKEIAGKIKIISEIAFQTNILALNAAVEAARAGEHGKGFAVVASEVRKLAERSRKAAEEIEQKATQVVSTSHNASQQLQSVVPDLKKTINLIHEIAAGSTQQKSGAQQINAALQELNGVVQTNTNLASRIAGASDNLAKNSEVLEQSVAFFKVEV